MLIYFVTKMFRISVLTRYLKYAIINLFCILLLIIKSILLMHEFQTKPRITLITQFTNRKQTSIFVEDFPWI